MLFLIGIYNPNDNKELCINLKENEGIYIDGEAFSGTDISILVLPPNAKLDPYSLSFSNINTLFISTFNIDNRAFFRDSTEFDGNDLPSWFEKLNLHGTHYLNKIIVYGDVSIETVKNMITCCDWDKVFIEKFSELKHGSILHNPNGKGNDYER